MKKLDPRHKALLQQGGVLCAIVTLLVAAVLSNGTPGLFPASTSKTPHPSATPQAKAAAAPVASKIPASGDYFVDFRAERADIRAEQLRLLNEVIEKGTDDPAAREASVLKVAVCGYIEQEFAIEQTLLAKGYDDVAAIVRGNLATVTVKKETLNKTDAARILDAVLRETGLNAECVKIIPAQ